MSAAIDPAAHGGRGGQAPEDFDLNLAPIIDCFVVLITYLLMSASFISLGILDVGLTAAGDGSSAQTEPTSAVSLIVELTPSKKLLLKISGAAEQSFALPPNAEGSWNLDALKAKSTQIKERWPLLDDITVTAHDSIRYRDVVHVLEGLRTVFPKVALGNN